MYEPSQPASGQEPYTAHPRRFAENRYVYPVVSRRAGGVSIGVNLNLDKICNFDCIYCQVNRGEPGEKEFLEIDRLVAELDRTIELVTSGRIYESPPFCNLPPGLRRLNDIALSGDGEPTTYRNFDEVVAACAEVRRRHKLDAMKLVLITNATMFHRPTVEAALKTLDANNGELWAKLDAGTEAYYQLVDRTSIPFQRILDNLRLAALQRPIVIQSLFMRIRGASPPEEEIAAYGQRLCEIVAAGGRIKLVQIHTIARPPAEAWVAALSADELRVLGERVRGRTGLVVEEFPGYA
jgi:wyosine [tRNA(Phe)-imidazoG37] synthetase (radical SAM superfamily)